MSTKSVLIIGGTGAQGTAVVGYLSSLGSYKLRCMTRDTSSSQAQKLASLLHVTIIPGGPGGHDEELFRQALTDVDYVWVNTNGFAIGEQAEIFWGMRMFELSARAGIKHFIYSGMESAYQKSGYDPKCRAGHYEGKAKVCEWMLSQPKSPMAWTALDSAAYLEDFYELFAPKKDANGTYVFTLPFGDGVAPVIYLGDKAKYLHWAFEHPEESNGLRLAMATCHISGADIASALTAVSGKPARFQQVPIDMWLHAAFDGLPKGVDTKVGYRTVHETALLQTYGEDFGNWFNLYKPNGSEMGILNRDYALLDKILPDRVKSAEEWMRLVGYTGEPKSMLKDLADGRADLKN